jgi:hypothetical protein
MKITCIVILPNIGRTEWWTVDATSNGIGWTSYANESYWPCWSWWATTTTIESLSARDAAINVALYESNRSTNVHDKFTWSKKQKRHLAIYSYLNCLP